MDPQTRSLYERLKSFRFDEQEHPPLSFADRLARENGWSEAFTQRVLREYRRFLLLCVKAGHPVTPSDAVDQAWHLHMIYTRSYWDRLCGQTLGQPVHHGPTRGGQKERSKFNDWYQRTLESYQRIFGESPPSDIWPSGRIRFAPAKWVRVDADRHWIIRKPRWSRQTVATSVLLALAIGAAGCTGLTSRDSERLGWVVGVTLGAAIIGGLMIRASRRSGTRSRKPWRRGSSHAVGGCGAAAGGGAGIIHSQSVNRPTLEDGDLTSTGDISDGAGCGDNGCGASGCGGGGGCGGGCGGG